MFILPNKKIFFFFFLIFFFVPLLDVQYSVRGVCGLILDEIVDKAPFEGQSCDLNCTSSRYGRKNFRPRISRTPWQMHGRKTALNTPLKKRMHVYVEILTLFFSAEEIIDVRRDRMRLRSSGVGH